MTFLNQLNVGQRLSFEVYPTAILGNNFKDVMLDSILRAQTAINFGTDIHSLHAKIYPTLPAGMVTDDPFGYLYLRIIHANGEAQVIGAPWIRPETLVVSRGGRITMVFEDKTHSDLDMITNSLSAINQRPMQIMTDD